MLETKDIMSEGMACLTERMGVLKTEMFIAAVIRDNFDYTKWQRMHFDAKTPEEISREASAYEKTHPFMGKAVRI